MSTLNNMCDRLPWERLSGCNILVTGATGLIGSSVIDLLMSVPHLDFHVYASGRNEDRAKIRFGKYLHYSHFHFLKYNVEEALDSNVDFHYIIHAASNASPNFFAKDPVGVVLANILGTKNLLDYGKGHGLKRFLYISSGEVYGNGDNERWVEDDSGYVDCMTMRSCYPTSKRAAETLCVAYSKQYDLDVVVARPCHTYGPHFTTNDNRAYAEFFRKALNGEDIVLKSKGEQYRSWIYVEDCAYAIATVLLKGNNCEAYNIADEDSCVTIRSLAEQIAKLGNVGLDFDLPSDIEKQGFSVIRKAVFDTTKLRELGWSPLYSLKQGLEKTFRILSDSSTRNDK